MKYLSVVLVILISTPCFHTNAAVPRAPSTNVIQDYNRDRGVIAARGGVEGWVKVSFLVDVDGKPKDIVAVDYSGSEKYIDRTIRYVNDLTYTPAMVDGAPTVSGKISFLANEVVGPYYSEDSVTPAFSNEYQQVVDILSTTKPDLVLARELIDELKDDHTKNLNEHAIAAWLEALYYYKAQDFLEYMRQVDITVELHKFTPAKILARSTVNLFEAQLHYGYYLEALDTLAKMQEIDGIDLSQEVLDQFMAQVESKLESVESFQVSAKLSPLGGWIYQNKLEKFKLTNVSGKIESVQLRCTGYNQTLLNGFQEPISLPADAKSCVTLVQGQKGTTFELHQVVQG